MQNKGEHVLLSCLSFLLSRDVSDFSRRRGGSYGWRDHESQVTPYLSLTNKVLSKEKFNNKKGFIRKVVYYNIVNPCSDSKLIKRSARCMNTGRERHKSNRREDSVEGSLRSEGLGVWSDGRTTVKESREGPRTQ